MEQALKDPEYIEQIDLMKKMKKRGIIADVETELRKGNARKILYSTLQKADNNR